MFNKYLKFFRKIKYRIRNYKSIYNVFSGLSKDSVFIDIGGNVGRVSQYISDVYEPLSIEIYEPHIELYKFLKEKFRYNKNIFIFNNAVSNKNSEGLLFLKTNKNDDLSQFEGSSLEGKKKNINKDYFQPVKLIDINEILDKYEFIDCIKIDIEGHEYAIIESLIQNKHKIGRLVCEFHGTDEDIANNKNHEFRKEYLHYIKKLKELEEENWLIMWH